MLLHTIIDLNDVFYQPENKACDLCCKDIGNLHIEGEKSQQGIKIKRIISTNPNDYLNKIYNVGNFIA